MQLKKFSTLGMGLLLLGSAPVFAQKDVNVTAKSKTKEQVTISFDKNNSEKIVVEVDGDKVTVNGKPVENYESGNISVQRSKGGTTVRNYGTQALTGMNLYNDMSNKAMLGVTTDKTEQGARVQSVTKESAASIAGIKEGDIITKIGSTKITDPDVLSETIKEKKPGDKVDVYLLRDKKEQKLTAELKKWSGVSAYSFSPGEFNFQDGVAIENLFSDLNGAYAYPGDRLATPRTRNFNDVYVTGLGTPKFGISVQDTDDGVGVKVIKVSDESTASKAGIKVDDIVTGVDDKEVNSTDEISKILRDSKDKVSVKMKVKRDGKSQTIDVKIPRKIKTANL
jgi:serine protease Do